MQTYKGKYNTATGPKGTLFDLGLDKLYYDLDVLPFGFDAPLPNVAWTPRLLAVRCGEIEAETGLSIRLSGTSTPIDMICPCGASVRNVVFQDATPRLDRYSADRLVMCEACGKVLVIFMDGLYAQ